MSRHSCIWQIILVPAGVQSFFEWCDCEKGTNLHSAWSWKGLWINQHSTNPLWHRNEKALLCCMQIKKDEKGARGQIILSHHLKNVLWTEHHRLLPNNVRSLNFSWRLWQRSGWRAVYTFRPSLENEHRRGTVCCDTALQQSRILAVAVK